MEATLGQGTRVRATTLQPVCKVWRGGGGRGALAFSLAKNISIKERELAPSGRGRASGCPGVPGIAAGWAPALPPPPLLLHGLAAETEAATAAVRVHLRVEVAPDLRATAVAARGRLDGLDQFPGGGRRRVAHEPAHCTFPSSEAPAQPLPPRAAAGSHRPTCAGAVEGGAFELSRAAEGASVGQTVSRGEHGAASQ